MSVHVDGEGVPFGTLFTALVKGRTHLVLPSGLWFPLRDGRFARAHRPDRGVPRAAGGAGAHAAGEPARHECVGPDRAGRRRRGPCPGLAGARPGRRAGAVPGRAPAPGRGHRDDAPLPAGGVRLARDAVRERPRGRARRRHGSGQDSADARARTARARPGPRRPAVPRGGAHQRRRHLAQRGGPVHARPAGGDGDGHVPHPRRNHDRRAREHRGRRRDVVRTVQARAPSLPGGQLGGAGARRGAEREEPRVGRLPGGARPRRPLDPRRDRHPHGEQPDGAVGADVAGRAWPAPGDAAGVQRRVPAADRARPRRRAAGRAAAPGGAADPAPDQGAGRPRPAAEDRAGARGRPRPRAPARVRRVPRARAQQGARPRR